VSLTRENDSAMDSLPFGRPGRFYKGNLHTHSTNSDGAHPPDEVIRRYREAGYDFLALSDHFMDDYDFPVTDTRHLRSDDFTTIVSAELHVGHTRVKELWHILAIGIPVDFERPNPDETAPEIARRAADAGAFVGIVHPGWYGLTTDDAKEITSADASLKKRTASPTDCPERFMKVCGFISSALAPPSRPSATSARNFDRQGPKPCSPAIRSTAMKPMLCRCRAYCPPGLPSPTISRIAPLSRSPVPRLTAAPS